MPRRGRAAGLVVLGGRGTPSARQHLEWARGLVRRLQAHVLLDLVTAAAEVDLAAWEGDARTAVDVALAAGRRLERAWEDDHLGVLPLCRSELAPVEFGSASCRDRV